MRKWGAGGRVLTQGWFSEECRASRREAILAVRKYRSVGTGEARNAYLVLRRQYEATIKKSKKSWAGKGGSKNRSYGKERSK